MNQTRECVIDSIQARTGGARLWNAGPRHTSGVKTLLRSGGWREAVVSGGVDASNCAGEIKSNVKANPKSGLTKMEVAVVGQRVWSETQNESSSLPCLSESRNGMTGGAAEWPGSTLE